LSKIFRISILFFIFASFIYAKGGFPKSYYDIKSTKMKKMVFFNTLVPLIKKQNEQILKDREFIEQFFKTGVLNTKRDGIAMLKMIKLKKYYKVKKLYDYDSYMKKINIIPTSIILAQAALESGWGNSRFTKEANNIFGHWTYGQLKWCIQTSKKLERKNYKKQQTA